MRAVPAGNDFNDDLISALLSLDDDNATTTMTATTRSPADNECDHVSLASLGGGGRQHQQHQHRQHAPSAASFTCGNMLAEVLPDGRLQFTRLSDNKILLQEIAPRSFTSNPSLPVKGFFSLSASFEAAPADKAEVERIYGLGQHTSGSFTTTHNNPQKIYMRTNCMARARLDH